MRDTSERNRRIKRITEWSPIGRRKRGRPLIPRRDEVAESIKRIDLKDGQWQNNWRKYPGEGRKRP